MRTGGSSLAIPRFRCSQIMPWYLMQVNAKPLILTQSPGCAFIALRVSLPCHGATPKVFSRFKCFVPTGWFWGLLIVILVTPEAPLANQTP
ncbi:hypothetical protein BDZ91DRAFT_347401 [Kalaharituber pfeilii]|nr:hypothetical protein BDZ91DRAFT_347401 [Kalaharituber pfeilii]